MNNRSNTQQDKSDSTVESSKETSANDAPAMNEESMDKSSAND